MWRMRERKLVETVVSHSGSRLSGVGSHHFRFTSSLCGGARARSEHVTERAHETESSSYSDRSACRTSTRAARMAGMSEAMAAAPMSTIAAPITDSAPGRCTVPNAPSATRMSA